MDVDLLYQKRRISHTPDMRLVHYHRVSGSLWFVVGAVFGLGVGVVAGLIIMHELQRPASTPPIVPSVNTPPPLKAE